MERKAYLAGVAALYSGEVWGEAFASRWLRSCADQRHKHVLAMLLQLESEAKVRLRPLLAALGLSLIEEEGERAAGAKAAEPYLALPWPAAMRALADLARQYVIEYRRLLDVAPPADAPTIRYMVAHEEVLVRYAERSAALDPAADAELLPLLAHPLPNL
jgi:hypothetical protein